MFAILLVIFEATLWYDQQIKLGIKASPMTLGLFTVIIGGMTLITFPEIFQRLKEIRTMSNGTIVTDVDDIDGRDPFRVGR